MNQNASSNNSRNIFESTQEIPNQKKMKRILIVSMLLVVIGCFLPYFTLSAHNFSERVNYVFHDNNIQNGVYVIVLLIGSLFATYKKSYKWVIGCVSFAIGIFIFDFIDVQMRMNELTIGGSVELRFGLGFYVIGASLLATLIMAIISYKKLHLMPPVPTKDEIADSVDKQTAVQNEIVHEEEVLTSMLQPQQVTTCKYCGNSRKDGFFCKSCGGRY